MQPFHIFVTRVWNGCNITASLKNRIKEVIILDLLLYNGNIVTMNAEKERVEAVCVDGGHIAYVGGLDKALSLCTSQTRKIDLRNRTLIPGFHDSHLHNVKYGYFKSCCDLSDCTSLGHVVEKVRQFIADNKKPEGAWVIGRGWNQDLFDVKVFPRREDLDRISLTRPILLHRCCTHMLVVNSAALSALNIDGNTPQVEGGEFDVSTGLFTEKARRLALAGIPHESVEDIKEYIKKACADLAEHGITSIQSDDFAMAENSQTIVQAYSELAESGELCVRVTQQCQMPDIHHLNRFIEKDLKARNIGDFYRIGPIKILADGSLGARTAYLSSPYCDDPQTRGMMLHTEEAMAKMIKTAHDSGYPVAIHCIGDGAANICIDAIEKAKRERPNDSIRHGIVHCQITDKAILNKFKTLDLLAFVQPIFLDYDLHIVEDRVGKELARTSYNFKTMLDMGIHMSIGTDSPVEKFDPLPNIYCGVTRKDKKGYPAEGFFPEQRLSIYDSVYCYTHGSAYCSGEERQKGSIEEGFFADFTVLSDNIFGMEDSPEKLLDVSIDMTIVNGKIVYASGP